MFDVIYFVIWVITGIVTLIAGNINRMAYGCAWLCLVIELTYRFIK